MQLIPLDQIQLPAYLANRSVSNDVFSSGLPTGGGFPMIGLKGTRFVVKSDGAETVLPSTEIAVILISAKQNLDKAFYATAYDPNNTEVKAPDCFSKDGIRPDASSSLKQCDNCAGCPQNQFGSGKNQSGQPTAGKACSDTKMLAIFANNGVYGFKIPPASLKGFAHYVKETSRRGVDLSTAITVVGFDPNVSYPVLTFNFGGFLAEEQVGKIGALKGTDAVQDIIGGTVTLVTPPVQQIAPVVVAEVATASDPFASVAPAEQATTAPPKVEKVKPIKPVKPVEVVPVDDDLAGLAAELGIDL